MLIVIGVHTSWHEFGRLVAHGEGGDRNGGGIVIVHVRKIRRGHVVMSLLANRFVVGGAMRSASDVCTDHERIYPFE